MVIGADGLVLTIGYLMLEAQPIEIVTQEGETLPAVAVAYDVATGFGLVKPLLPLRGVKPVNLGSQQNLKTGEPTGFFRHLGIPHRQRTFYQPASDGG